MSPTAHGLILYGEKYWFSPFVFSVFVALHEKRLTFEERTFDLFTAKDHLNPEFQRASVTGTVPALVHGDFWLTESSAIVEYLDEAFPDAGPLLPGNPRERARARQVMGFLRSAVEPLRDERPTHTMFYERTTAPLSPHAQRCADKLLRVAGALISPVGGLSAAWSIADAELGFMLHRLTLNGDAVPPGLAAYAQAQWARPSVQAFVRHARPAQYTGG